MRLINFQATNVHDYLNFNIKFNEDVTFLIGINGTGKTSVLKIILGLISPSYSYLNQIDFDYAKLECWDNEQSNKIKIECRKIDGNTLELTLQKASELFNHTGFLKKLTANETVSDDSDDENERLVSLRREFDVQPIIQEIKRLSTPIFLGLDRRIYEGHKIDRARQNIHLRRRLRKYNFADSANISLMDLQAVLYDFYRQIAFKQPSINEQFRNQIISGSFEFVEDSQFTSFRDLGELSEKREKVLTAIEKLNMEAFLPQIKSFFDKMEETQKNVKEIQLIKKIRNENPNRIKDDKDEIDIMQKWFTNQPQLKRINEIIELSQKYQEQIELLFEPIERIKKIINTFLQENNKKLIIDGRGDISVELKNGKNSSIFELSSGEKQIITIIGHLIFFEEQFKKEPGVFIIDEPELSLHLAWQQIFVSSLIEASPKTQLILATHSPSIVENYNDDHCEDLAKLN